MRTRTTEIFASLLENFLSVYKEPVLLMLLWVGTRNHLEQELIVLQGLRSFVLAHFCERRDIFLNSIAFWNVMPGPSGGDSGSRCLLAREPCRQSGL